MPRWIWPGLLMGVGFCSVGARFFLRWDLASLPPGAKTAITARRGVLICWCYGERTEDFLLLFSLHLSSPGFLRACSTWFLSGRLGAGSLDLFLVLVISHRVMILRCRFILILRRAWPLGCCWPGSIYGEYIYISSAMILMTPCLRLGVMCLL